MEWAVAGIAGVISAHACTLSPQLLHAVTPLVEKFNHEVRDVHKKTSCLFRFGKTSDSVPASTGKSKPCTKALAKALGYTGPTKPSKNPRQNSGKSTKGTRVAGKRSVSIRKTTPARAVKSASGSASSRREEGAQPDEVIPTEGEDDSEDEDKEESDTKKSQKAKECKQVIFPMYMLPKKGEGDSKPVTGPGETRIVVELEGRQVIPLHINDWSVDGIVWKRFQTPGIQSWAWFMQVPPAHNVKSDKKDQKLLHINVYDLAKAAENKTSKGLTVPKDMVEIIKMNTKEIISRAGDLNTFPDSVMAAGGPKLRDENYDYGAK